MGDALGAELSLSGAAVKANPVLFERIRRKSPSVTESFTIVCTLLSSNPLVTTKEKSSSI